MSNRSAVSEMDMDPEEYAALWAGRAAEAVRQRNEERARCLRLVIALVRAAGGEIRAPLFDLLWLDKSYDLIQWHDIESSETVYRVRKKPIVAHAAHTGEPPTRSTEGT